MEKGKETDKDKEEDTVVHSAVINLSKWHGIT